MDIDENGCLIDFPTASEIRYIVKNKRTFNVKEIHEAILEAIEQDNNYVVLIKDIPKYIEDGLIKLGYSFHINGFNQKILKWN